MSPGGTPPARSLGLRAITSAAVSAIVVRASFSVRASAPRRRRPLVEENDGADRTKCWAGAARHRRPITLRALLRTGRQTRPPARRGLSDRRLDANHGRRLTK